jgi:hypothetical protein
MEAIIPAQAIRIAGIGQSIKPAWCDALVVANRYAHAVEDFIGLFARLQVHQQRAKGGDDRVVGRADRTIELGAVRQARKEMSQPLGGKAGESAFGGKLFPLGSNRQSDNFTLRQVRASTRQGWADRLGLDRIIDQDVQCSQKGVQIQH